MNIIDFIWSAPGKAKDFASEKGTQLGSGIFKWATNANEVLVAAGDVFSNGSDNVIRGLVLQVLKRTLGAVSQELGGVVTVWEGIFTNRINADTFAFVLANRSDVIRFLVELAEPLKLYAAANSADGSPGENNVHRQDIPYNELDLTSAMNRHAVTCQVQRLTKSLSFMLAGSTDRVALGGLQMDTTLRSDFNADGSPLALAIYKTSEVSWPEGDESWLFVNGIGGEYHWLKLACEKLSAKFQRRITGIFNRSDGILWDLVECAGERLAAGGQEREIPRTQSSNRAQERLKEELSNALWGQSKKCVVVIAHSQGCLLLRLVLEEFVKTQEKAKLDIMKSRLMVFTFGSPSVDWKAHDCPSGKNEQLHLHARHTEHFANKDDFVAKLGVLSSGKLQDSGYVDEFTFINDQPDWTGHLFGAQYSLSAEHYRKRNSKLLACADGTAMT